MIASLAVNLGCGAGSDPTDSKQLQQSQDALKIPAVGSGSVFAPISNPPGFPEGIVVVGNRVYVAGPATLGTAGLGASQVLVFDLETGAPRGSIAIQGEALSQEHALSCITSDARGRLYVLSTQLGVVRLSPQGTGFKQDIYAPLPADLPACAPGAAGACSPTIYDGPPLLNDLAFDWEGNLYFTDSFQATVFRVPRGGGTPQVWFQSAAFGALPYSIGLNGIRVSPDQKSVYVTVSATVANPGAGYVYSIPRVAAPREADLKVVHAYTAGEGPDGVAFSLGGKLYVALANGNAISVLAHDGSEKARYTGPAGSPVGYDAPANLAFDYRGSILVTNHAVATRNPASFAVLKVFAADLAFPLATPLLP